MPEARPRGGLSFIVDLIYLREVLSLRALPVRFRNERIGPRAHRRARRPSAIGWPASVGVRGYAIFSLGNGANVSRYRAVEGLGIRIARVASRSRLRHRR